MRIRHLNKQNQISVYRSIDRFNQLTSLPEGYVVVRHHDVPIDLYYKSRDSDTTVVCFHGAVEKDVRLPWHIGAGVLAGSGANRLAISDPTLYLHEEVRIGWFAGSAQIPDQHQVLEWIIRKTLEITNTQHVIFFGGSAGGFAALAMSRHFPGSIALPMNPQTSIHKFYEAPVNKYVSNAWAGLNSLRDAPETVPHDLSKLYTLDHQNTVAFIQNNRDKFHIRHHQEPFYEVLHPHRTWTLRGDWGTEKDNGHVTPPRPVTSKILQELAGSSGQWNEALHISGFVAGT